MRDGRTRESIRTLKVSLKINMHVKDHFTHQGLADEGLDDREGAFQELA